MCGPHGLKFLQPVELRLPHCASVNPESWSFALKSSDSPTGTNKGNYRSVYSFHLIKDRIWISVKFKCGISTSKIKHPDFALRLFARLISSLFQSEWSL